MIADMKQLAHEADANKFQLMMADFVLKWSRFPDFLSYFDTYYVKNNAYRNWSVAHQSSRYTNMETNNYVESWHNQLKTTYLKRKANRRVDRLVYILVNDVEPDYIQNINRLNLRIGRMGPQEREARKRELCAEQIPASVLAEYVSKVSAGDSTHENLRITLFTNEGTHVNVCVDEGKIVSCSCPYFAQRQTACKHIYLARRYNPALQIQQATQLEDFPAFEGLVEPLGNDTNVHFH